MDCGFLSLMFETFLDGLKVKVGRGKDTKVLACRLMNSLLQVGNV